jgi:hypothetical protein
MKTTATQSKPGSDLMSIEEVMGILRKPRQTLAMWRYYGKGPAFVKAGRSVLYPRAEFLEWQRANTHQSTGEYAR